MMQTHLFLCETKTGFSKYSIFWKVGAGFETPTSLRAPLDEELVQKDIMLGEGAQNMIGSSRVGGAAPVFMKGLFSWSVGRGCLVCFIWTVLSLEVCFYGDFIRHFQSCLSGSILAKADIIFPKSVCCSSGYKYTDAFSERFLNLQRERNLGEWALWWDPHLVSTDRASRRESLLLGVKTQHFYMSVNQL